MFTIIQHLQTIGLNYVETNDISPMCDTINGSNMMYTCGGMNIGYGGNGISCRGTYLSI